MADARELTYGISFNSEDAVNDVEQLEQGLGRIDDATDRAQIGAQNCSQAMSSMGAAGTSAARDVGSAAQNMSERFEEAGDDTTLLEIFSSATFDEITYDEALKEVDSEK